MTKPNLSAAILLENIGKNNQAISGLADVLQLIRTERAFEDCPDWCKSDRLGECLELAIAQLANYARAHADELAEELKPETGIDAAPPAKGKSLTH